MAKRIQRKRTKGWRMPENAVYVGRPTKWGNPFTAKSEGSLSRALLNYRSRMCGMIDIGAVDLNELRGKDLMCWCPLDRPCHVDVLLELIQERI